MVNTNQLLFKSSSFFLISYLSRLTHDGADSCFPTPSCVHRQHQPTSRTRSTEERNMRAHGQPHGSGRKKAPVAVAAAVQLVATLVVLGALTTRAALCDKQSSSLLRTAAPSSTGSQTSGRVKMSELSSAVSAVAAGTPVSFPSSVSSLTSSSSAKSAVAMPKGGYLNWKGTSKSNAFKFVCYMTNWAQYRPNATRHTPAQLDPFLCTHVIYAFAAINTSTHEIRAFEWNDESKDDLVGRYEELNRLKQINPSLKTLLAVGGWNMGTKPFADMAKDEANRRAFVRSAVRFVRKWKFDGLDLDWEFPAKREGSSDQDKESFTHLVRDLRDAFYIEAMATRKEQLLLSAAVAAEKFTVLRAYDIENIVAHLDFISIMSYDYHGSWDQKLGHNSPLYAAPGERDDDRRLNVDWTVRLYLTLGVPLEKLILGIPYYGRSFTLRSRTERTFGAAATGDGRPGESTRENGFLSYGLEICKYVRADNWTRGWSRDHQVPYAYKANQWVGYDDEESVRLKVAYVVRHCLGGAMVWSIDLDDFTGACAERPYPLTRLIMSSLQKDMDRRKCAALVKIKDDPDVQRYLASVVKWVPSSAELGEEVDDKKLLELGIELTLEPASSTVVALNTSKPPSIVSLVSSGRKRTTRPSPVYQLDNKSRRVNNLTLLAAAYQNSAAAASNDTRLNQLLRHFLSNMTRLRIGGGGGGGGGVAEMNYLAGMNRQMLSHAALMRMQLGGHVATQNQSSAGILGTPLGFKYWQTANSAAGAAAHNAFNNEISNEISNEAGIAGVAFMTTTSATSSTTAKTRVEGNYGCENLSDGEFVRDPADCSSFYTCFMGRVTKKTTCDTGLYFDKKLHVCNWKDNVECLN